MFALAKAVFSGHSVRFHVPSVSHLLHKGEHVVHMGYFGLVAMEAHGSYRYAAGVLLVMSVLGLFFHEAEAVAEEVL
jgi:hypothetical protein